MNSVNPLDTKDVNNDPEPAVVRSTNNYRFVTAQFCNIRSLYPKLSLVENHINSCAIDLMFFTETWLTSRISDSMLSINNYTAIRSDRSYSKGGGVILFHRDGLNIKCIDVDSSKFDSAIANFEFLCIDLFENGLRTRFVCIYLPPKFSVCANTVKTLCKLIDNLSDPSIPCFVIGDFNLPKIDWEHYSTTGGITDNIFLQFCINNGWTQHIQTSTHIKNNTLDLLLSNFLGNKYLQSFSVTPPLTTNCDHNVISINLFTKTHYKSLPGPRLLNFKKANIDKISEELSSVAWNFPSLHNNLPTSHVLQEFYDYFVSTITEVIKRNTPLKPSNSKIGKCPKHIKKILKHKLSVYKRYKTDKNLKQTYKEISLEYENAVKQWRNKIEERACQNPSSRKFYSFVNKKFKSKSTIPPLLSKDNHLCFSDLEKANIFNDSFQKVFTIDDGNSLTNQLQSPYMMDDFVITSKDILWAVSRMKGKLTRSPEGIPSYILKQIAHSILMPLNFIFNSSLQNHWVPQQWKSSFIVPIFKKGNKSNPLNYRPISLTSSFSRLFESILHLKISNHLYSHSLISSHQYGFLKNKSSCEQLLTCIHNWLCSAFNSKSNVNVIYTDIAKAFDTVSHKKLVQTIKSFGVSENVVNWITEFLENRVQSVCVGTSVSSSLPIHSGVPQGSVIGPLLFLIYINGIIMSVITTNRSTGIRLFADDAKLFDTNQSNLQLSLNNFVSWLDNHQLKIAVHKCFSISFPKPNPPITPPTFTINNEPLLYNPLIKDLGVYISDNMKWESHINAIVQRAALKSYQLLKSFKSKNIWILKKLFCTYVRPQLEYNTPVWSPYLLKDKNNIESIQRRYTKAIFRRCSIPFTSYEDRLHQINLESLEQRRINYDLILLYKIINGLSCIQFSDYFDYKDINYNLRRNTVQIKSKIIIKSTNKLWLNNFFNRTPAIWNNLPDEVVTSQNLYIFKSRLKGFNFPITK